MVFQRITINSRGFIGICLVFEENTSSQRNIHAFVRSVCYIIFFVLGSLCVILFSLCLVSVCSRDSHGALSVCSGFCRVAMGRTAYGLQTSLDADSLHYLQHLAGKNTSVIISHVKYFILTSIM